MQTQSLHVQNLCRIVEHYTSFPRAFLTNQNATEGKDHFIVYGESLNLALLQQFQQKCGENFVIFEAWNVVQNTVVLLRGQWQAKWVANAHEFSLDCARLDFTPSLQQSGLLVMDMDSTIIQIECIDEIAKLAGTGKLVSEITERAMRGELDFEQSLRHRVSTLKNAPETILQQVRENLPLMPGLKETIQGLQQYGWKTAIASGGFTYFANYLKALLNLDYAVSNQFEITDGRLTGLVLGDVVDAAYKANTLQRLATQFAIPAGNTVAIGDGANDLAMMQVADLGMAYHAKPKVQQQAKIVINFTNLTALLCILSANDKIQAINKGK
ncbi:phosphoserine phosphatase SerB [Actinobacillus seminis]|uniref:Phosphoserine phosphatase n=1 Tax=Actinobacillus seminis TaxID=722 RepID=A0A263HEV4_9PAST|nr:phosphoserine phosphatase [Actinobacillus seminis]OZN25187.1 phosphoserine phosphatase SerB [Actinobacillus seminis]SUU34023.1 phosphoserine phosphatase [Actinobacillus seminis]